MAIGFYRERDKPYGCFSNFSKHSFEINEQSWPTAEHYFQAQKFVGTPQEEAIRLAPDPMTAKTMGNDRGFPIRADWDAVKADVMREAVRAKFTQHEDIRTILLGTGSEVLIEAAPNDYYWGCGKDGSGQNKLGLILMEARDELR
ncbi:MAG: NADAR family protein [Janthinobacterium lividum]